MVEIKKPRPLKPGEPLDNAVYCTNCKFFEQDIIGYKTGTCMGHQVMEGAWPIECQYYQNEIKIVSVLIFLRSGVSVYHKAIIPDLSNGLEPNLLSSFLQAITMFGEELTNDELHQIQFRKMNIFVCRSNQAYGALLVKGEVDDACKTIFTSFLSEVENRFPEYFEKDAKGTLLPEKEVDKIALSSIKDYIGTKVYNVCPNAIENGCKLKYDFHEFEK